MAVVDDVFLEVLRCCLPDIPTQHLYILVAVEPVYEVFHGTMLPPRE
jgi:hypothetical protein